MFKKAKKYILIFLIVLLLLAQTPFLMKKKANLDKISEPANEYKLSENENIKVKLRDTFPLFTRIDKKYHLTAGWMGYTLMEK